MNKLGWDPVNNNRDDAGSATKKLFGEYLISPAGAMH